MLKMKKNIVLFIMFLLLPTINFGSSKKYVKVIEKIDAVVNTQKIFELPVYKITIKKDTQLKDNYLLLKDLAKIFSATLTYHPAGGYISFNYRGEKLYFYINRDYFVSSKKRIYLSSEIISVENRTFVPISILNMYEFSSLLNADIQFKKKQNVLIINFVDNVLLSYYVAENYAKIQFVMKPQIHYEYYYANYSINITFFGGRISPKEYHIVNGVVNKISVLKDNGNAVVKVYVPDLDIKIKKEDSKETLVLEIERTKKIQKDVKKILEPTIGVSTIGTSAKTDISTKTVEKASRQTPSTNQQYIKTIVIDPGHGGEDPGAIGPNETAEKNVNLNIAKYLKEMLISEGYNVVLTREDDTFIPLVERTKFANDKNADIFISIHCNAAEKSQGSEKGFEIYFLSEFATDPDAIATEKLENEVVKFEKKTPELEKLQKLLWSMVVNEFMNESSKLCSLIAKEVVQRTQLQNRGVKQAGFYVLRGAKMPAVLVECGFISNPIEEIKLNRKEFQLSIANGICAGIKNYDQDKNKK